jgi:hypothetical protein
MKLKVLAAGTVLALTALTTAHAQTLTGCYVPQSGFANSQSISAEEQIGTYRIVLVKDTGPLRDRRLVLSGPFKGKIVDGTNPLAPLLDHVLGDLNLEGLILTKDDEGSVTPPIDPNTTTLTVTEVLNPIAGTGKFSGLRPTGNSITVTGTLDLATGTNTFDVEPGGQVCFD